MFDRYARASLPDRSSLARQWHKVVSPRGRMPLIVGLVGNQLEEFWTHYDTDLKRTLPCTGEGNCNYCRAHVVRRYKAFCAAVDCQTRELCVVEISEGAARTLLADPLAKPGLRGLMITLRRFKHHPNAPVHIFIASARTRTASIPPAFDVMPSLMRLWDNLEAKRGKCLYPAADEEQLAEGELPPEPGQGRA